MNENHPTQNETIQVTIDKFWEVIPPLWRGIRKFIHDQAVDEFRITLSQFHILRHIHTGMDSVSKLAKIGRISRPAISRGVDTLVQKGLVTRETDSDDRRHILLGLTPDGKALLEKLFGNTRSWMTDKMESLTNEEMEQINQAFDALQRAFTIQEHNS